MAVSVLQSTFTNVASSTSLSKAFSSNNTAGNTLVALVAAHRVGGIGTISISDTAGQNYRLLGNTPFTSSSETYCYIFENCASGANTIQISSSIAVDLNLDILELTGVPTSNADDGYNGASAAVGTGGTLSSGTITTKNANDLLLAYGYNQSNSGVTFTPSAGFTLLQNNNAGVASSAVFTQSVSSIGTYSNTMTNSASTNGFVSVIFAFADTSVTTLMKLEQVSLDVAILNQSSLQLGQVSLDIALVNPHPSGTTAVQPIMFVIT